MYDPSLAAKFFPSLQQRRAEYDPINQTYTERDIVAEVLEVYTGDYFDEDLAGLPEQDLINAFLDEIQGSIDARWQMTKRIGEWYTPHFNVKTVDSLQAKGYNIYRIRPLSPRLSKYRILYGYDAEFDQFYLLAVAIKKPQNAASTSNPYYYNYEPTHRITLRICAEYDNLRLPRLC